MKTKTPKTLTTVEQFIAALGGQMVKIESHWQQCFEYDGLKFLVSSSNDKFNIGLNGPVYYSQITYRKADEFRNGNDFETSIGFSASRKAEDLAKDFKRRIDIDAIKTWLELRKEDEADHKKYIDGSLQTAQLIAGMTGGRVMVSNGSSHRIDVHSDRWYSMNGPIRVEGESVYFELSGVKNMDLVRDLCKVIEKYRKVK
jgi:hypothetical protein